MKKKNPTKPKIYKWAIIKCAGWHCFVETKLPLKCQHGSEFNKVDSLGAWLVYIIMPGVMSQFSYHFSLFLNYYKAFLNSYRKEKLKGVILLSNPPLSLLNSPWQSRITVGTNKHELKLEIGNFVSLLSFKVITQISLTMLNFLRLSLKQKP